MERARTPLTAKPWKIAGTVASLAIFVFALWLLQRALAKYEFADIVARLSETPASAIALSLAASMGSYLALGGFDWLAIHYLRRRVPVGLTVLASFISHGISHSAGFAALTGGAIRYRIYTAAGLTPLEVGAVIVFCGFTFVIGAGVLAATALITEPAKFAALSQIPADALRWVGLAILGAVALYVLAGMVRRGPIRMLGRSVDVPGPRIAGLQIAVAAVDLGCAAACLWVLLPEGAPPIWAFVGIYVLSNLAGIVAHTPGGLGVFESAVVLMTPEVPADATIGALVLFRVTYNLVPLGMSMVMMLLYEGAARRKRRGRTGAVWMRELAPAVLSVLVFGAGAMLLFTGAAPDSAERMALARRYLPIPVMQAAHLLAAGMGAGLLLVARGVFRRLANAHAAAQVLLALGAASAVLRAWDWEEAVFCAVVMLHLYIFRRSFYRRRDVVGLGYTPSWIGAGVSILIATGWLTLVAFRQAAEHLDLATIGMIEVDGAARAFRALVAAVLVYTAILALAARRRQGGPAAPGAAELARAAGAVRLARAPAGQRGLRGDLNLMFDASGACFLPYRRLSGHWVALGEPVGPEAGWPDLAWAFRESCEDAGVAPVFLFVAHRPLYLDLGLGFQPLADEARLDVSHQPLLPALRRGHDEAVQAGLAFVEEAGRVVVRRDGGMVAEAELWRARDEAMLAELRPAPGAPECAKAFLAVEAAALARARGCAWLSLGLVPVEGADADLLRALARLSGRPVLPSLPHGVHKRRLYAALPPDTGFAALVAELSGASGARSIPGAPGSPPATAP